MQKAKNRTLGAQIKLTAAMAVWGGSFIATKIAVAEVSPISVIWLRFLIGWIVLGWFAYRQKELALSSWKDTLQFTWLGFLGITLHQWLQTYGLVTVQASTTAWLVSTAPIFMALMGWLFLKEKISSQIAAGILLATVGVMMVVSKGEIRSMLSGGFGQPGDMLVLLSASNWAVYSAASRPVLQKHSAIKVTFYMVFFGWLLSSFQFVAGRHWSEFGQLSMNGWISILFLGVFCSALANIFYNDGLQYLPATQVGIFLYLEPLVATLIAAGLLSEEIMLATLFGGGLILAGVWLVNRNAADLANDQKSTREH